MEAEGKLSGGGSLGASALPASNFTISRDGWSGGNCTSGMPFFARFFERFLLEGSGVYGVLQVGVQEGQHEGGVHARGNRGGGCGLLGCCGVGDRGA